jgi:PDZ domain-containing protein
VRRLRAFFLVVLLILAVVLGLSRWTLQVYSITPGNSEAVSPLVSVRGLSTDPAADRILLTDVYLEQLNALTWIEAHFQPHTELVNADQLVQPGVPTSELVAQGYVDMAQSKLFAKVAALRALGWTIPSRASGAVVYEVLNPSSAYTAGLRVADRIVSVDGASVVSACSLTRAIHAEPVGTRLVLRVERAHVSERGSITLSAPSTMSVTTSATPADVVDSGCPGVSGRPASFIGVGMEDAEDFTLPGSISIRTPLIGGPSAGLAMTLTLVDRLSAGSLTGHHAVAATGTIDPQGQVGDVGGVAEKTIAVERAGASVFIVPKVEVKVARSASDGRLRVLGVTSLAQALGDLRRLGGDAPTPLTKPYRL